MVHRPSPRPRHPEVPEVTQQEARRLYEASGSVDGRQVALRELSRRVRAQREALEALEAFGGLA